MSQMPPQGYPPNYPPGGMPPYGYPPGYGYPAPKRANGAAIASLVCGLLGCTFILSPVAILLGYIGLKKTRDPQVGGRGMAIAGLILGLFFFCLYMLAGAGLGYVYKTTQPARDMTARTIQDLSIGGSLSAAAVNAPALNANRLAQLETQCHSYGVYRDLTMYSRNYSNYNGVEKLQMAGVASFAQGIHPITVTCVKKNGAWTLNSMTIQ